MLSIYFPRSRKISNFSAFYILLIARSININILKNHTIANFIKHMPGSLQPGGAMLKTVDFAY